MADSPTPVTDRQRNLAQSFLETHRAHFEQRFGRFADRLVCWKDEAGQRHWFPPYVPFLGAEYDSQRILVYSTAQNLAGHPKVRKRYRNQGNDAVFRLCFPASSDESAWTRLDIGPVNSGIAPALVGLFILARRGEVVGDLDRVTALMAISNYFKYSSWRMPANPDEKATDLNPNTQPDAHRYAVITFDSYIREELGVLRPQVVFCQKGPACTLLRKASSSARFELVCFNDPAWIKRGHGGCLKPARSWGRIAAEVRDPEALGLIEDYARQIRGGVGKYTNRIDEVKIYLARYFYSFKYERRA